MDVAVERFLGTFSRGARGRAFFAVLCVVFLSGCLITPIRRSAFVPRHTLPANHGAPIGDEGLKGFAQVNTLRVAPNEIGSIDDLLGRIPQEGAAGLWMPRLHVGAGVYGAPNENLTVGAHLSYTRLEWAYQNVLGVLPFPEGHDDQQIFFGGPGLRVNFPVRNAEGKKIFTPALLAEVNLASIPQAVYVLRDGAVVLNPDTGEFELADYEFVRIDNELFLLPTVAAHFTISPIEYLHIVGMVGAQRNVKNIGFDPDIERLDESTLSGYFNGFAGGGLEGRYEFVYATAMLSAPFAQPREIRHGLSATFSVGILLR